MGETRKQKQVFTLMMCFGMVLGMTTYNIILHTGLNINVFSLLIKELGFVFIIAFLLDNFIVGPFAKKQVFSRVGPETKTIVVILSIATTMVVSMVLIMSVFGSIVSEGFTLNALKVYPKTVLLNLIAALPLNLLVVSPIVRGLFVKIFPPKVVKA
nr:DUF2798 domain-containing protein [uncultured Carboxylicivirga sp.]